MSDWVEDKAWSDRFLVEIKRILGEHLIGAAPQEEDAERNTDLIVLRMDAVRIACRIRHYQYLMKYGEGFTIRTARPSGAKTELAKIVEGWGRYMFYGFANEDESALGIWTLMDLNVFRLWFNGSIVKNAGVIPGEERPNKDGSSTFRGFKYAKMPNGLIVARGGEL
jgi:hypothetical protein